MNNDQERTKRVAKEWIYCDCGVCRQMAWITMVAVHLEEEDAADHNERLLAAHQEVCRQHTYQPHN